MTNKQLDKGIKFLNDLVYDPLLGDMVRRGTLKMILEAMKEETVAIEMELSPCCRAGIQVRLGQEGECCLRCGKKLKKPDPIREVYEKWNLKARPYPLSLTLVPTIPEIDKCISMWRAIKKYCEGE